MSTITVYPSMVETKTTRPIAGKTFPERGEITCFSRKSRMRLLKLIHSLTFEKPLLLTLTYQDYPKDGKTYHGHLRAFREAFERRYGKQRVIWKLEFQKRGAPHFHLVCLDLVKVEIPEMGRAWARIIGIEDQEGKWQCFDAKNKDAKGNDLRNAAAYAAKYVGKEVTEEDYSGVSNPGRFWGRWNIRGADFVRFHVPEFEVQEVARALREMLGYSDEPFEWYTPENNTLFAGNAGSDAYRLQIIDKLLEMGYKIDTHSG